MGKVRHPAAAAKPAQQGKRRHDDHQNARLDRQDAPDVDPLARPVPGEPEQDAEHRPGRPDDGGVGGEQGEQGAGEPAHEIQPEKPRAPQPVLEPGPEEEQGEHVEEDVPQAGVQKHVGDDRPRPGEDQAGNQHEKAHPPEPTEAKRDEVHGPIGQEQAGDPGCHHHHGAIPTT